MSDDSDFDKRARAWRKGGNGSIPHAHIAIEWWKDIRGQVTSQSFVKRVLGYGTTSLWYGESGSAKTFLAFYLAFCVALGQPFFNRKVKQGLVIFVAAEAGSSMRQRIEAFRQHYALPDDDDVPFALIAAPVNLLDPDIDLEALIGEIKAAAAAWPDMPLLLIVVDTLSRTFSGGNENAPDDMGAFIRNIDRLRRETEAHVAIVHHSGKTASLGARGHSLLRAAVDTEIEVVKSDTLKLSTATVTKQRDEESGSVFAFRLHVVELGYDEDGEIITSCALEPLETPAEAPKPRSKPRPLPPEDLRALDFLRDVVAELGQPLNREGFPNVMAVTVEQWRQHLQRRGLYDPDVAGRNRFKRRKERLIAARLVTIDGDLVWPVPRPVAVVTPFPGTDPPA
jgi:hypothetical protein